MTELPKIKDAEFQDFTSKPGLVLVDFSATWCGPCKKLHPILGEIAASRDDVTIGMVDIQEAPKAAQSCGVMSVPQVHVWKDGEKVDQFIGLQNKAFIDAMIDRHK